MAEEAETLEDAFPVLQEPAKACCCCGIRLLVSSDCLCRAKQSNGADETENKNFPKKIEKILVDKANYYYFSALVCLAKETRV